MPITYYDSEKCLRMYGKLFSVMLGDQHILCQSYQNFCNMFIYVMHDALYDLIERQEHMHAPCSHHEAGPA